MKIATPPEKSHSPLQGFPLVLRTLGVAPQNLTGGLCLNGGIVFQMGGVNFQLGGIILGGGGGAVSKKIVKCGVCAPPCPPSHYRKLCFLPAFPLQKLRSCQVPPFLKILLEVQPPHPPCRKVEGGVPIMIKNCLFLSRFKTGNLNLLFYCHNCFI